MTLPKGMRSILAYFPSSTKAQAAVDEIKEIGITDISLDRISRYGITNDSHLNNPLNDAETITGLTLFSENQDRFSNSDARILRAADPSVSGMAAHDYGVAGGKAFLVTVVTTDELGERAARC
ncbi:hypothetical protein N752_02885 [Desulforamulus aquiferis]|nr:hypothetical protein [Desulforamulus aquiferis]RYD06632.1 hypothetical protein N752_02885 [Desulforamulus aquiferis]